VIPELVLVDPMSPVLCILLTLARPAQIPGRYPQIKSPEYISQREVKLNICKALANATAWSDREGIERRASQTDIPLYRMALTRNPALWLEAEGLRIIDRIVVNAVDTCAQIHARRNVLTVHGSTSLLGLAPERAGGRRRHAHTLVDTCTQEYALVNLRTHADLLGGLEGVAHFSRCAFIGSPIVR
jgi:hypothetical protein